jgi:hypothetical protein
MFKIFIYHQYLLKYIKILPYSPKFILFFFANKIKFIYTLNIKLIKGDKYEKYG